MSDTTIGWKIKMFRKLRGLTQAQLAEKSGVATISIHQYEADKRKPRLEQLEKIADALDVNLNSLIDLSEISPSLNEAVPYVDSLRKLRQSNPGDPIVLSEEDKMAIATLSELFKKIPDEISNSEALSDALKNEYCTIFDTLNFHGKILAVKLVDALASDQELRID